MPRFCNPAPETLIAHRQERITVSVRTPREHCKVLKIGWSRRDGSLFVHLPVSAGLEVQRFRRS